MFFQNHLSPYHFITKSISLFLIFAHLLITLPHEAFAEKHLSSPPFSSILQTLNTLAQNVSLEDYQIRPNSKLIIYIADAHDSFEAQTNIAKIISKLVTTNSLTTVFQEGYEGEVPTDIYFNSIQNQQVKERTALFLLDNLRLGGAEYAHILRSKPFDLIGIDDQQLHQNNIRWYRALAKDRAQILEELSEIQNKIRQIPSNHYSKAIRDYFKIKDAFDQNKGDSVSSLAQLVQLYTKYVSGHTFMLRFPNLALILEAAHAKSAALASRAEHIPSKDFFEEMHRLEQDLTDQILRNNPDRRLVEFEIMIRLLKRLTNLELNDSEWSVASKAIRNLQTQPIADELAKRLKKPVVLSSAWEQKIQSAVLFYETAQARDLMVENKILKWAAHSKTDKSILVFGGFHQSHLKDIFLRNNLSYVMLRPKITHRSKRHENLYQTLMTDGHLAFETPLSVNQMTSQERLWQQPYAQPLIDRISQSASRHLRMRQTHWLKLAETELANELLTIRSELRTSSNRLNQWLSEHGYQTVPETIPESLRLDFIESALIEGKLPLNQLPSPVLRFIKFLKRNNLDHTVIMGGTVINLFFGLPPHDFDLSVKIPLNSWERQQFDQHISSVVPKTIYEASQANLKAIARSMGVSPRRLRLPAHSPGLPLFENFPVHYFGPVQANISGGTVLLKEYLVDSETGRSFPSYSGPTILSVAIDNEGNFYGSKEALVDLIFGKQRLQGNGVNFTVGNVLRTLRLRERYGLQISSEDYEQIRVAAKSAKGYLSPIAEDIIEDLLLISKNKEALIQELIDLEIIGKSHPLLKKHRSELRVRQLGRLAKGLSIVVLASAISAGSFSATSINTALAQTPRPNATQSQRRSAPRPPTQPQTPSLSTQINNLIKELSNKDAEKVRVAQLKLKTIGEPAIAPLISALNTEDKKSLKPKAQVLGALGQPAVQPLLEAIKNDEANIRHGAIAALGLIKDPRTVPPLMTLLKEGTDEDKTFCLWAFGEMKETSALPSIYNAFKNHPNDPRVRNYAIFALREMFDASNQEMRAILQQASEDQDSSVRKTALQAVMQANDEAALSEVVQAAGDLDIDIRKLAAQKLLQSNDPNIIKRIIQTASAALIGREPYDELIIQFGARAEPVLIESIHSDKPEIVAYAIQMAGKMKIEAAVPSIVNRFGMPPDPEGMTRLATASLEKIGTDEARFFALLAKREYRKATELKNAENIYQIFVLYQNNEATRIPFQNLARELHGAYGASYNETTRGWAQVLLFRTGQSDYLDEVVRILQNPTLPKSLVDAAKDCLRNPNKETIAALIPLAASGNIHAREILDSIPTSTESAAQLVESLTHNDDKAEYAKEKLFRMGKIIVPQLVEVITNETWNFSYSAPPKPQGRHAAEVLARMQEWKALMEALNQKLKGPLSSTTYIDSDFLLKNLDSLIIERELALSFFGKLLTIESYGGSLDVNNYRGIAIEALEKIGGRETVDPLLNFLQLPNVPEALTERPVETLSRLTIPADIPRLLEMLSPRTTVYYNKTDVSFNMAIARVLAAHETAIVPKMYDILKDPDADNAKKNTAIYILAMTKNEEHLEIVRDAFWGDYEEAGHERINNTSYPYQISLRKTAADALSRVGTEKDKFFADMYLNDDGSFDHLKKYPRRVEWAREALRDEVLKDRVKQFLIQEGAFRKWDSFRHSPSEWIFGLICASIFIVPILIFTVYHFIVYSSQTIQAWYILHRFFINTSEYENALVNLLFHNPSGKDTYWLPYFKSTVLARISRFGRNASSQTISNIKNFLNSRIETFKNKKRAILALEKIGNSDAIQALFDSLNGNDDAFLTAVSTSLQRLNDPKAKFYSCLYLGKIDDAARFPSAIEFSFNALNHSTRNIRLNALRVLNRHKKSLTDEQLQVVGAIYTSDQNHLDLRIQAAEVFGGLSNNYAEENLIFHGLNSQDSQLRAASLVALRQNTSDRARFYVAVEDRAFDSAAKIPNGSDLALAALSHRHPNVRGGGAEVLGMLKHEPAEAKLISTLEDADTGVQTSASNALSKLATPRAQFFHYVFSEATAQAVRVEGSLGMNKEAAAFKNPRMRAHAALVAAELNDQSSVPTLIRELGTPENGSIAVAFVNALAKLVPNITWNDLKQFASLLPELTRERFVTRTETDYVYTDSYNMESVEREITVEEGESDRRTAEQKIIPLIHALAAHGQVMAPLIPSFARIIDNEKGRYDAAAAAAEGLGKIGDESSEMTLIGLLSDSNLAKKTGAAKGLGYRDTTRAQFYHHLFNRNYEELKKIPDIAALISKAKSHPSPQIVENNIRLIGHAQRIGHESYLGEILRGENIQHKAAAIWTIGQIRDPQLVSKLIKLMETTQPDEIKIAGMGILAKLDPDSRLQAIPILLSYRRNGSPDIKTQARDCLTEILQENTFQLSEALVNRLISANQIENFLDLYDIAPKLFRSDVRIPQNITKLVLRIRERTSRMPVADQQKYVTGLAQSINKYMSCCGQTKDTQRMLEEYDGIHRFYGIVYDNLQLVLSAMTAIKKTTKDFEALRLALPINNPLSRIIRMLGETRKQDLGGFQHVTTILINSGQFETFMGVVVRLSSRPGRQHNAAAEVGGMLEILEATEDLSKWGPSEWNRFEQQIHRYYVEVHKVINKTFFDYFRKNENNPQAIATLRVDIEREFLNAAWGNFFGFSEEFRKRYNVTTADELALLGKYMPIRNSYVKDHEVLYKGVQSALEARGKVWQEEVDPQLRERYQLGGSQSVTVYQPDEGQAVNRDEIHANLKNYSSTQDPDDLDEALAQYLQMPSYENEQHYKKAALQETAHISGTNLSDFQDTPSDEREVQRWLNTWYTLLNDAYRNDMQPNLSARVDKILDQAKPDEIDQQIAQQNLPAYTVIRDQKELFKVDSDMAIVCANPELSRTEKIKALADIFERKWLTMIATTDISNDAGFQGWIQRGINKFLNKLYKEVQKRSGNLSKAELQPIVEDALILAQQSKKKEYKGMDDRTRRLPLLRDRLIAKTRGIFDEDIKDIQQELKGFKTVTTATSEQFYVGLFDDLLHLMGCMMSGVCTANERPRQIREKSYHFAKLAVKNANGRIGGVSQVQLTRAGIKGHSHAKSSKGWRTMALPGINLSHESIGLGQDNSFMALLEYAQRTAAAAGLEGAVIPINSGINSNHDFEHKKIAELVHKKWLKEVELTDTIVLSTGANKYSYNKVYLIQIPESAFILQSTTDEARLQHEVTETERLDKEASLLFSEGLGEIVYVTRNPLEQTLANQAKSKVEEVVKRMPAEAIRRIRDNVQITGSRLRIRTDLARETSFVNKADSEIELTLGRDVFYTPEKMEETTLTEMIAELFTAFILDDYTALKEQSKINENAYFKIENIKGLLTYRYYLARAYKIVHKLVWSPEHFLSEKSANEAKAILKKQEEDLDRFTRDMTNIRQWNLFLNVMDDADPDFMAINYIHLLSRAGALEDTEQIDALIETIARQPALDQPSLAALRNTLAAYYFQGKIFLHLGDHNQEREQFQHFDQSASLHEQRDNLALTNNQNAFYQGLRQMLHRSLPLSHEEMNQEAARLVERNVFGEAERNSQVGPTLEEFLIRRIGRQAFDSLREHLSAQRGTDKDIPLIQINKLDLDDGANADDYSSAVYQQGEGVDYDLVFKGGARSTDWVTQLFPFPSSGEAGEIPGDEEDDLRSELRLMSNLSPTFEGVGNLAISAKELNQLSKEEMEELLIGLTRWPKIRLIVYGNIAQTSSHKNNVMEYLLHYPQVRFQGGGLDRFFFSSANGSVNIVEFVGKQRPFTPHSRIKRVVLDHAPGKIILGFLYTAAEGHLPEIIEENGQLIDVHHFYTEIIQNFLTMQVVGWSA